MRRHDRAVRGATLDRELGDHLAAGARAPLSPVVELIESLGHSSCIQNDPKVQILLRPYHGMYPTRPSWHAIPPPGTFVFGSQQPDFRADETHVVAALRRVTFPSLQQIVDDVVHVADRMERGDTSALADRFEMVNAMRVIPREYREGIAKRRPDAMIPFLGSAGRYLAPLQLVGDVECVRTYCLEIPGSMAVTMYQTPGAGETAPECEITPATINPETTCARYIDVLRESDASWPLRQTVLISNAEIQPDGYRDIGRSGCEEMIRILRALPSLRKAWRSASLPRLPAGHMDWGVGLLLLDGARRSR